MSGKMSDFQISGGKPLRIVEYTSGSGTFTPLEANSWCRVTIVGAGQGGGCPNNAGIGAGGGSGGSVGVFWMRVAASAAYVVAAGGAGATSQGTQGVIGGASYFGSVSVPGGPLAGSSNVQVNGAQGTNPPPLGQGFLGGNSGPGGNAGVAGTSIPGGGTGGAGAAGYGGGGGGAGSVYGTAGIGGAGNAAGTGGAGTAATGYGAGGGGGGSGSAAGGVGGAGSGGLIIVEEFGA